MAQLSQLCNGLPLAAAMPRVGQIILDVVGVIGIVLIVVLLVEAIAMIPDFIRYMRLKSM